jgi:hypothetical protein
MANQNSMDPDARANLTGGNEPSNHDWADQRSRHYLPIRGEAVSEPASDSHFGPQRSPETPMNPLPSRGFCSRIEAAKERSRTYED